MKITENLKNNVCRIYLNGRFDADTCGTVEESIRENINEGRHKFVLDMESVSFIASAGLRVVIVIAKELRRNYDGDLHVASLQPNVNRVFEISGLDNVLRIFDDAEAATRGFTE
ncbi:STAS domain-containing protein [Desulfococcaceae bacterium HSG8]|nr:STAS domain-containing protein [Desulfococcaceae bacterium HSG8]